MNKVNLNNTRLFRTLSLKYLVQAIRFYVVIVSWLKYLENLVIILIYLKLFPFSFSSILVNENTSSSIIGN